ncbi:MAG: DUF1697 domain-containing protein [Cellulomonas sp.]
MTSAVALLRGINVGGKRKVPMAELRACVEAVGHTRVATLLNSGNVVLTLRDDADGHGADVHGADAHRVDVHASLAAEVTDGLRARLGLDVDVVVRTRAEFDAVIAANPFATAARDDPAHLVVMFYGAPVTVDPAFDMAAYGRERVVWAGRDAYLHYLDDIGHSTLTPAVLTRAAGQAGTGRNWRTVLALRDLLHDRD